jgi:rRNA maturation RNase YbeY
MSVRLLAPVGHGLPRFDSRRLLARAARVLAELGHRGSELSLALVSDAEIAALNSAWRRKRGPTDVLAFPLLEGEHAERAGALLGDVVISLETAARQARAGGRTLDAELARLLVHGVLHLLGHDHLRPAEMRAMRAEERRLLRALAR